MMASPKQVFNFTPITNAYVHNMWFIQWKMQHNVVLGQVIVQNPKMMYYIDNVYECPCQLHMSLFNSDKLCSPFHIQASLLQ
jgi:hypothetical protein